MRKLLRVIGLIPEIDINTLYEGFADVCFAGKHGHYFNLFLPFEDSRVGCFLRWMGNLGHRPWTHLSEKQLHDMDMEVIREYEASDYEDASLLVPKPRVHMDGWVEADGGILLDGTSSKSSTDIGFMNRVSRFILSRKIMELFQASGLRKLAFTQVDIRDRRDVRSTASFWRLTSSYILPPLAPTCRLLSINGVPLSGNHDLGCYLTEQDEQTGVYYDEAELHYQASTVAEMEPFDIALTRERFGSFGRNAERIPVVSKCFYDFCVSHHIEFEWVPVRIELTGLRRHY